MAEGMGIPTPGQTLLMAGALEGRPRDGMNIAVAALCRKLRRAASRKQRGLRHWPVGRPSRT